MLSSDAHKYLSHGFLCICGRNVVFWYLFPLPLSSVTLTWAFAELLISVVTSGTVSAGVCYTYSLLAGLAEVRRCSLLSFLSSLSYFSWAMTSQLLAFRGINYAYKNVHLKCKWMKASAWSFLLASCCPDQALGRKSSWKMKWAQPCANSFWFNMTSETKDCEGAEPLTKLISRAVNYTCEVPTGRLRSPNKIG